MAEKHGKQYGEPLIVSMLKPLLLLGIMKKDARRIHGFWDSEARGERRIDPTADAAIQMHADHPTTLSVVQGEEE